VQALIAFYAANGLHAVRCGSRSPVEDLETEKTPQWDSARLRYLDKVVEQEVASGITWRTLKETTIVLDGHEEITNPFKGQLSYAWPGQNEWVMKLRKTGKSKLARALFKS
jgi:hypothetical protein